MTASGAEWKATDPRTIALTLNEPFGMGSVRLRGTDLMKLSEREMRQIRGNRISMIFQEPMTSLNPVLTVGRQIAETVQLHQKASRADAMKRAVEMLRVVQIPEPERRVNEYPHQLSGGMKAVASSAPAARLSRCCGFTPPEPLRTPTFNRRAATHTLPIPATRVAAMMTIKFIAACARGTAVSTVSGPLPVHKKRKGRHTTAFGGGAATGRRDQATPLALNQAVARCQPSSAALLT